MKYLIALSLVLSGCGTAKIRALDCKLIYSSFDGDVYECDGFPRSSLEKDR